MFQTPDKHSLARREQGSAHETVRQTNTRVIYQATDLARRERGYSAAKTDPVIIVPIQFFPTPFFSRKLSILHYQYFEFYAIP